MQRSPLQLSEPRAGPRLTAMNEDIAAGNDLADPNAVDKTYRAVHREVEEVLRRVAERLDMLPKSARHARYEQNISTKLWMKLTGMTLAKDSKRSIKEMAFGLTIQLMLDAIAKTNDPETINNEILGGEKITTLLMLIVEDFIICCRDAVRMERENEWRASEELPLITLRFESEIASDDPDIEMGGGSDGMQPGDGSSIGAGSDGGEGDKSNEDKAVDKGPGHGSGQSSDNRDDSKDGRDEYGEKGGTEARSGAAAIGDNDVDMLDDGAELPTASTIPVIPLDAETVPSTGEEGLHASPLAPAQMPSDNLDAQFGSNFATTLEFIGPRLCDINLSNITDESDRDSQAESISPPKAVRYGTSMPPEELDIRSTSEAPAERSTSGAPAEELRSKSFEPSFEPSDRSDGRSEARSEIPRPTIRYGSPIPTDELDLPPTSDREEEAGGSPSTILRRSLAGSPTLSTRDDAEEDLDAAPANETAAQRSMRLERLKRARTPGGGAASTEPQSKMSRGEDMATTRTTTDRTDVEYFCNSDTGTRAGPTARTVNVVGTVVWTGHITARASDVVDRLPRRSFDNEALD